MFRHYSKVVSTLALIVSLSTGGAYAASSISGSTIKNHTIGVSKLTPLAIKQLKGHDGLDGYNGADGAPGASGGFDPNKIVYITGPDTVIVPATAYNTLTATCPYGYKVISGGWFSDIGDDYKEAASIDGTSYTVNVSTFAYTIYGSGRAYAVCVSP